jgi:hypothetical protein
MTIVKCKECGHQLSSFANICPNCGAPKSAFISNQSSIPRQKKRSKGAAVFLIFILFIIIVFTFKYGFQGSSDKRSSTKNVKLSSALSYLNEINEIKWVDIYDNDVYIGFDPLPSDYKIVCKAAALHGNKAINFGVHVWAINARKYQKGWRPGDGTYYYETTARYGKIQD